MTTISQPSVSSVILPASTVVQNESQFVLFVGQITTGSATSGQLIQNIQIGDEDALFGADSMLATMIRSARQINEVNRFDAISLDDNGSAVSSAGVVTFVGTATTSGTIEVVIGSEREHTYSVVVAVGDDETAIGDALVALITADTLSPVTAVNAAGVVTLTAKNGGTLANGFALGVSDNTTIGGVTSALTAFAGGAGDPVLTDIFDVIGTTRYQGIVWPYWDDTTELADLLQSRWNVSNNVLDGIGFTSSVEGSAAAVTRLDALNFQTLVTIVDANTDEDFYKGSAQPEFSYVKASQVAAIRALRLSDGEPISQYVISSNGPLDAFGGSHLASKPYFNTSMPFLPAAGVGRGFSELEIEQLHDAGGSVIGTVPSGASVVLGEIVTAYKEDGAGNPDISFKYLNYADTMTSIREYFFRNLRKRFAQSRLSEGDIVPGYDIATPIVISSYCTELFSDLQDIALCQAGEDALNFFKSNLIVAVDMAVGQANITSVTPIVTQLRRLDQTIQIAFSPEG